MADRATRLVAREVSELMLARGIRWQEAMGVGRLDCLLFQVVLSANLAHLPLGFSARSDALAARRPISLMAVAESMHMPYETVRRRMAHMRGKGLVALDAGGAMVPRDAAPAAVLAAMVEADAAALSRTLRTLAAAGYPPAATLAAEPLEHIAPRVRARALLDFAVRIMENFVPIYGSMVAGTVCVGIIAANVRHLRVNPGATAGRLPDDSERRPIPLRLLARELDLPWETVRRQVAALVAAGTVEMLPTGAIVPGRVLAGEAHRRNNRNILVQFERMLASLTRA